MGNVIGHQQRGARDGISDPTTTGAADLKGLPGFDHDPGGSRGDSFPLPVAMTDPQFGSSSRHASGSTFQRKVGPHGQHLPHQPVRTVRLEAHVVASPGSGRPGTVCTGPHAPTRKEDGVPRLEDFDVGNLRRLGESHRAAAHVETVPIVARASPT